MEEDPGTSWLILTEASWLFSWQARQVSLPNSMTGLGPAFWEVGQIVPKAQDPCSPSPSPDWEGSGKRDGKDAWVLGTAARCLRSSGAGGSRQVQVCGCWGGLTSASGAVQSGGDAGPRLVRMGKQRAGGSWKNGFGAEDTWGRGAVSGGGRAG